MNHAAKPAARACCPRSRHQGDAQLSHAALSLPIKPSLYAADCTYGVFRGVVRRIAELPALRKPRRTPHKGRVGSPTKLLRETDAWQKLTHCGFQFPRDLPRIDKRRCTSEQLYLARAHEPLAASRLAAECAFAVLLTLLSPAAKAERARRSAVQWQKQKGELPLPLC